MKNKMEQKKCFALFAKTLIRGVKMKKTISKKIIIPVIIIILILLIILLENIFTNNKLIKQIVPGLFRQEEDEMLVDGIVCKVLDNTGEKIKAFVTITREKRNRKYRIYSK